MCVHVACFSTTNRLKGVLKTTYFCINIHGKSLFKKQAIYFYENVIIFGLIQTISNILNLKTQRWAWKYAKKTLTEHFILFSNIFRYPKTTNSNNNIVIPLKLYTSILIIFTRNLLITLHCIIKMNSL